MERLYTLSQRLRNNYYSDGTVRSLVDDHLHKILAFEIEFPKIPKLGSIDLNGWALETGNTTALLGDYMIDIRGAIKSKLLGNDEYSDDSSDSDKYTGRLSTSYNSSDDSSDSDKDENIADRSQSIKNNSDTNLMNMVNGGMDFVTNMLRPPASRRDGWESCKELQDTLEKIQKHLASSVELEFRTLIRKISPGSCNNGNASFKSIYNKVFSELKLTEYNKLLDFVRLIRNTLHHNGTYLPERNTGNKNLEFKSKIYTFKYGENLTFFIQNY